MDEVSKLEYQQRVESYLEENGIYDLFEGLMKDVIYEKPIDLIDYLI
jgi:hypothetical protein